MPILKIHKNALYVNNELVKFQFEIDTVLVLDSQVIVLIKTPYDIDDNDNVYSVDFHGKITWQIESAKKRFHGKEDIGGLFGFLGGGGNFRTDAQREY